MSNRTSKFKYCYFYNLEFREHTIRLIKTDDSGSLLITSNTIEKLLDKVKDLDIELYNDLDSKINKKVIVAFS